MKQSHRAIFAFVEAKKKWPNIVKIEHTNKMKRVKRNNECSYIGWPQCIRTVTLATTILMEFNESFYYCCSSSNNTLQTNNFNFQLGKSIADNEKVKFSNDAIHRFCMDLSRSLSRFILQHINGFLSLQDFLFSIRQNKSRQFIYKYQNAIEEKKKTKIDKFEKTVVAKVARHTKTEGNNNRYVTLFHILNYCISLESYEKHHHNNEITLKIHIFGRSGGADGLRANRTKKTESPDRFFCVLHLC